jgi:hypothetical protein
MKPVIGLFLCFVLAMTGCASPPTITKAGELRAPGVDARFRRAIDEIEQMIRETISSNGIPGLSIALADSHGPIWEAG